MADVMVDLETLGTKRDCVVLSIGLVKFDKTGIIEELYLELPIKTQKDFGRTVDQSTLDWWNLQSKEARKILYERVGGEDKTPILIAIAKVQQFIEINDFVWSNGCNFDISILEDFILQFDATLPWKYRNVMDFRTFKRFCVKEMSERAGVHHNALDDARYQATVVMKNWGEIHV